MNYIDKIAKEIGEKCGCEFSYFVASKHYNGLLRLYAVLCLSKGKLTTRRDVHDAWSAWTASFNLEHKSLIPFEELTPEVQEFDQPYVDAIHSVAAKLNECDVCGRDSSYHNCEKV